MIQLYIHIYVTESSVHVIYVFILGFFLGTGYHKILIIVPVLYNRPLLVIYFIYRSVYVLIPYS